MISNLIKDLKALHKAFLKFKTIPELLERFNVNFMSILNSINENETEEFNKNLVFDFLKKFYYDPNYSMNIKELNIPKVVCINSLNKKSALILNSYWN